MVVSPRARSHTALTIKQLAVKNGHACHTADEFEV